MNSVKDSFPYEASGVHGDAGAIKNNTKPFETPSLEYANSATGFAEKLPVILRGVGALAVAASAIVYMLQGLQGVDMFLRHWVYLLLMVVLTAGGVGSQQLFRDSLGARVFFLLAAMLVPVQATQLSAMLFNFVSAGFQGAVFEWAISGGLTIVFASLCCYLCLSIMARPTAGRLSIIYLLLNALLLLPFRDAWSVFLITITMAALYFYTERRIFSQDSRFNLLEGSLVRLMLVSPLIILMVRSGFRLEMYFGAGALAQFVAFTLAYTAVRHITQSMLKSAMLFAAYLLAALASLVMVSSLTFGYPSLFHVPEAFIAFCFGLPLVVIALAIAECSSDKKFYRVLAILSFAVIAISGLLYGLESQLLLLVVSLCLLVFGVYQKSRALLVVAGVVMLIDLFFVSFEALSNIANISWFSLAITGVALVALSSLAERYGCQILVHGENGFTRIKEWEF